MSAAHQEWIASYLAKKRGFVRGACSEATKEMMAAFPELRRAGGFVQVQWGREQHWWCVAPDGSIVDPTVDQYGAVGVFDYEELDLDDPKTREIVPTGRCMECGLDAFGGRQFCSDNCECDFAADLNEARR